MKTAIEMETQMLKIVSSYIGHEIVNIIPGRQDLFYAIFMP